MLPVVLKPGVVEPFPDPRRADVEGLVAVGGDLSVERLLLAYEHGIFPWFGEENPELWWSPDPRAVLVPGELHVSRSMARCLASGRFSWTWNKAFGDVMRACSENRPDGVWILPEMVEAYTQLHRHGRAHSLEVWQGEDLVGGVYGVQCGGVFAGESMFHRVTNASKFALITLVRAIAERGIELVDVQIKTSHLESMGVENIPRIEYLERLAALRAKPVELSDLSAKSE